MRLRLLACSCALGLVIAPAILAQPAQATSFRVVSLSASAQLTFATATRNGRTTGRADIRIVRRGRSSAGRSDGSVGPRGGAITIPLRVTGGERAKIRERSGSTSPYVEQQCRNVTALSTLGGLRFRSLGGGRMEVRWRLPHARMRTCPGPTGTGAKLEGRMRIVVPASRFAAARVRLALSGSARFRQGATSGTYRWRAVVTLARL